MIDVVAVYGMLSYLFFHSLSIGIADTFSRIHRVIMPSAQPTSALFYLPVNLQSLCSWKAHGI